MSRYVDADRLMERYKATCDIVCQYTKKQRDTMCVSCGLGSAIEVLEDFPAADVAEVKRGRWERCDFSAPSGGYTMYQCSVCACLYNEPSHYCPNCGAKMDEVEDNG